MCVCAMQRLKREGEKEEEEKMAKGLLVLISVSERFTRRASLFLTLSPPKTHDSIFSSLCVMCALFLYPFDLWSQNPSDTHIRGEGCVRNSFPENPATAAFQMRGEGSFSTSSAWCASQSSILSLHPEDRIGRVSSRGRRADVSQSLILDANSLDWNHLMIILK